MNVHGWRSLLGVVAVGATVVVAASAAMSTAGTEQRRGGVVNLAMVSPLSALPIWLTAAAAMASGAAGSS